MQDLGCSLVKETLQKHGRREAAARRRARPRRKVFCLQDQSYPGHLRKVVKNRKRVKSSQSSILSLARTVWQPTSVHSFCLDFLRSVRGCSRIEIEAENRGSSRPRVASRLKLGGSSTADACWRREHGPEQGMGRHTPNTATESESSVQGLRTTAGRDC